MTIDEFIKFLQDLHKTQKDLVAVLTRIAERLDDEKDRRDRDDWETRGRTEEHA